MNNNIDNSINEITRLMERRAAAIDGKKEPEGERKVFANLALAPFVSLARNAEAADPKVIGAELAIIPDSESLEKDGCDFIAACYYYLVSMGCPGSACDYVAVLAAITGGNSDTFVELTDAELSLVMNVTERTIQRKRKDLKDWMRLNKYEVVEIIEGEYNREHKKNAPTQYRVKIAPIASRIIYLARNKPIWSHSNPRAQRNALKEAAVDAVYENPEAPPPVKERKAKKKKSPSQELETARKIIFTQFIKMLRVEFKKENNPEAVAALWEELKFDMDATFERELDIFKETAGIF